MKIKRNIIRIKKKFIREINKFIGVLVSNILKIIKAGDMFREYWLIGGSLGRVYSDNSASLHKHILRHYPNVKIYWVINRNSKDIKKVKKYSNRILYKDSVKANILALLSKVHIVSHSKFDISSYKANVFKNVLKVHLGHGVHGFKKMKTSDKNIKTINSDYDLHIANSELEKKIKEQWGIESEKIFVTGMPRLDELQEKAQLVLGNQDLRTYREILYMPTWRDWLVGNSQLEYSSFYKHINRLIENKELHKTLERENTILNIYFHINMEKHIKKLLDLNLPNIKILSLESNLQDEIARSQLLITDYSSIAFDFLYLNKPVVFYQFDLEEYLSFRGSYLDMKKNLFGPIAYDYKELIRHLNSLLRNNKPPQTTVKKWKKKMFAFEDNNNCERVMEVILESIENKV